MNPRSTKRTPTRSFLRAWLVFGFVLGFSALVLRAPPTDGTVVHGNATIATAPNLTTVTADHNSVLRWGSFDISQGETVRFIQPGSDARVMNWIGGLTPSQIDGSLLANGQVYLLNPSGVFFGQTAVVDAARLYAVGGSLAKEDFLAGLDRFTGLTGSVSNAGTIRGDLVALIGRSVANTGTIVSPGGFVGLAAGGEVLLGQDGSSIFVNTGAASTAPAADGVGVTNSGSIDAGSGNAVLAAGDFYSIAITHDGTLAGRNVKIQGQGTGEVHVTGTINAASTTAGEVGGRIEVNGEKVGLFDDANLDASGPAGGGTILVGGDFQGKNPDIRNAFRTFVGLHATLNADATNNGNGGKVIIWADDITRFHGTITARGGLQGGDGGFVEVSGKETLVFRGMVNASAASGKHGSVLFDPRDITISDTVTPDGLAANDAFTENPGTDATFDADTITAVTNTGAAVTLQANRDIAVNEDIVSNNAGGDGGAITMQAGRSITIGANITTDNGNLTLTANDATSDTTANNRTDGAAGGISISGAFTLDAGTGSISATVDPTAATVGSSTFSPGNISLGTGTLTAAGGITFTGTSASTAITNAGAGTINVNGSVLTVSTASASSSFAGTVAGSGGLTKAGAGTLTLSQANTYAGGTTLSAGTLAVSNSGALGTGTLTTSGTPTLKGAGGGLVTLTNNVTLGAGSTTTVYVPFGDGGGDLVLSGIVSGGGALIVTSDTSGRGFLLSGNNTFTGGITLSTSSSSRPRLQLGHINALGDGALSTLTQDGAFGSVELSADLSGGVDNNIIINAASTLTINSNGQNGVLSGIISGATGALTKTGSGTVSLSGTNTYAGVTTISGGTLSVGAIENGGVAGNLGQAASAAANLVFDGGTLAYTGGAHSTDRLFTITNNGGALNASGTGALNFANTGSIAFSGTNARTFTLTGANTDSNVFAPVIGNNTGSTSLTKAGVGSWTLSSTQTYTGATTISDGTLTLGHATDTLADTSSLIVSGGTLSLGANSDTVNSVQITSGSITGSTGILTSTTAYDFQSGSISAILAGTAGATKSGSGTVTLSGVNTYTGVTTINDGVLSVGTIGNGGVAGNLGAAAADAANLVLGGGTLQYTGSDASTDRSFTLTNATSSSIDVSSAGTTLTLAGAGAATTGSLTKLGSGGLTLTGANAYTGTTTVSAGALNLNTTAADAIAGNLTVAGGSAVLQQSDQIANSADVVVSGGTLVLDANSEAVNGVQLTSGSITSTTGVLTSTTAYDLQAGSVSAILAGTAGLDKTTTGTVTLTGASTYTGTTTIKAGTLVVGANAPSGLAGALGSDAGAVVLGDTSGTDSASLLVNGAFTVGRAITVATGSSGTATVGGSNTSGTATFSGDITLNKAASLVAANGGTTDFSGAITDSTGAFTLTLDGATNSTLNLTGAVTVASLAVSASLQAISLTGDTTTIDNTVTFANTGALQLGDNLNDTLTFDGGLTATAPSSTALHGTITTSGDLLTFGNATLGSDTTLVATTTAFNGTLTGDNDKALAITGDAVFGDATTDTVSAVHDLSVSGATTINTAILSTVGAQTYSGAVTVGNDTAISTDGDNITFSSTINSEASEGNDLTVNSVGGTLTLSGAVGGGTNGSIGALALNSTVNIALPAITASSLAVTASDVTVNNAVSATTTATFNNSGVLTGTGVVTAGTQVNLDGSGDATLTTATPTVNLATGTTSGADVTLTNRNTGGVTISGGSATGVATLDVTSRDSGDTTNAPLVIGAGNLTTGTSVTLAGTSLTLNGDIVSPTITLNLAGDLTGTKELQASVELRLNGTGNVGASGSLIAISTPSLVLNKASGNVFVNNGAGALALNVDAFSGDGEFTSGALTLNDALDVGSNDLIFNTTTLALGANSVDAATITINNSGALTGTSGHSLNATTLNLNGLGAIGTGTSGRITTSAGAIAFNKAAGAGDTFLAETDAVTISGSTQGALDISAGGTVTLTGLTAAGGFTSDAAMDLSGTITGSMTFTNDVTLAGDTTFADAVTLGVGAGTLAFDANGNALTFADAITLTSDTSFTGGADPLAFNGAIDGAFDLTISAGAGGVSILGGVGATTPLTSLTVTGTASVAGTLRTDGNTQNYGNLVLTGDTTFVELDPAGDINFNGTIDSDGLGDWNLTADASAGLNVTFADAVGTAVNGELGILSVSAAGTINLNGGVIQTTGSQTYSNAVTLGAATTLDTTDAGASPAGAGITFGQTLDGDQALGLVAGSGNIDLNGAVGSATNLGALTVTTSGVTTLGGDITTDDNGGANSADVDLSLATGGITLASSITIDTDGQTDTSGGAINLSGSAVDGTTDGNETLTLNAEAGDVTLAEVGTTVNLGELTVSTSGVTTLGGDITTDDGSGANSANVDLSGATGGITLASSITIDTDGQADTSGGAVDLSGSTVDASTAGSETLTVNAEAGDVTLAAVGTGTNLGGLAVATSGVTTLGGDITTDDGSSANSADVDLSGATGGITLASSITIDTDGQTDGSGGAVDLSGSAVDGMTAGNETLTVNAEFGDVTLAAVGTGTALGAVDLTGATINLNGASLNTEGGSVDLNGAVILGTDVAIDTTNAGGSAAGNTVTFGSTLDGAQTLAITTGTAGDVVFTGLVGDTTPLGAFTINSANDVTANGVRAASFTQTTGQGTTTLNTAAGVGFATGTATEALNTSAAGGVSVTAKNITLNDLLTTGGAGDVILQATANGGGNVVLGSVTAAGNDVTVTAAGQINDDTSDATADITAATASLSAGTGIGAANGSVDLTVPTVTLATTATGGIDLNSLAAATFTNVNTTGVGAITVTGSGDTTFTSVDSFQGDIALTVDSGSLTATSVTAGSGGTGAGDIDLTTTTSGNVVLGSVSAAGNDVTVNSAGAITDNNGAANNITATTTSLTAVNDIGAVADPLELTVGSVSASGANIYLANTGGAALAGVTTAGDFSFTASGSITTTGAFNVDGNLSLTATGENDLTISNNITRNNTTTGSLNLVAGRSVIFNSSADATGTGVGGIYNVTLNADSNADGVSGGAIRLGSGTVITSNGGNITLGGGAAPGTVAAIGTAANIDGIRLDGAQLQSGAGNISLRGNGFAGTSDARGILFNGDGGAVAGLIQSASGTISLIGSGGAGVNNNGGVVIGNVGPTTATVTSASGAITITGTGGAGSGNNNMGVYLGGATGVVESTGAATIDITGHGGSGVTSNHGVWMQGGAVVRSTASGSGAITIVGDNTGTVTGSNNVGVRIDTGGDVASLGTATIDITGTGGAGTTDNHGVLVSGAGSTIASVSGNVGITGTAGTGGSSVVTDDAGATVDGGSGTILVDGNDGAISLAGALSTTNATGAAVTIRDATTAALGNITTGALGTVVLGGALTDNLSGAVTQTGIITAGTLTGNTSSTVNLNGANVLTNLAAFTTSGTFTLNNAGALNVTGAVNSGTGGVTLSTTSGALSIGTAGDITAGDVVSLTGAGGINTAGDITTSNDNVTFNSATLLQSNAVVIDTGAGAGDITFASTLDGAQNLTLTAGTTGNVTFTGLVGDTAAVGAITINSANDVTANGVRAASLLQTDGTGTTTLNQGDFTAGTDEAVTTTAASGVNITNETIALNHAVTTTGTGTVTLNADTTTLTIGANGDIAADGAVALTGAGGISTAGDVTTTADDITFNSATTLTGAVALNSANGNIVFNNTVNATTAGVQTLTLAAGTGTVDQNAAMGGSAALGAFTVTSAAQADLQAITATGGAIAVTASTINVDGVLTTTGGAGGALSITGGGITISATPSVGATNITLTGNGNDVVINSALTDDASITVTAPRDVIINATVQTTGAGSDLVFTADTNTDGVGGVLVRQAGQVDAGRHATLTGSALNSTLDSAAGESVYVVADGSNVQVQAVGNVALSSGASAPVGADIQVSGVVSSSGPATITVNAADQIGLAANVSTAGGDITFSDAVVLGADVQVSTGATGGNIVFSSTLNGTAGGAAENLTVLAGTGNVTFTGNVGNNTNNTELEALTITSAATALFSGNVELANALTQSAGTVATTFSGTVNVGSAALTGTAFNLNNSFASAGTTAFTNSGTLTKNATGAITSTGAFSTTGAANLANNITTTNTALTIGGNLKIAEGTSVTLSTQGAAGAGDITISGNTDGTTGGTAESLTLNAGTGTLTFSGSIHGFGGGLDSSGLNNVTVTNSGAANFNGTIAIFQALTQTNAATGTTTFGNTVSVGSATLRGTSYAINNTFASSGTTSFTNSGTITKNATGNITSTGAFSTTGDVNLAANITTTDADLTIGGNLVLAENVDVTLSTGAGGAGAVTVTGTTNGTAGGGDESLTVLAGTGDVTFTGNVGNNTDALELEALTITSAATALFSGNIELANALTQSAGSVATTFNGTVNVGSAALTGTAFNLNGDLSTSGGGTVAFTNSGLLTINANVTSDGAVTQNGAGAVAITGSRTISTTSDAVNFLQAVTLNGAGSTVAVNTTASGTGADITFQSALDATTAGATAEDLALTAGTAGSVTFTGAVGGGTRLGDVTIASANNVVETAGLTAATFTQTAGAGTTTLDGAVNTSAAGGVNLTGTNLAVNAGITTTTTGTVTVNQSGTATFAAAGDINADGAVSLTAASGISTAGDVTTSGDSVTFNSATTLTGAVALDTTNGSAAGANITFAQTLDGAQTLGLTAGTAGDVTFAGLVGDTAAVGAITINSANDVTANGMRAASLVQTTGTGTTTLNQGDFSSGIDEAVTTTTATGVNVANDVIALNHAITTTGTGVVTLNAENGALTIVAAGDIVADGAVSLTASGGISTAGDITTTDDDIGFASAVALTGPVTLNTGTGAGNITFSSTVNSDAAGTTRDLTLTAGAGSISLNDAAGTIASLEDLLITSAANVTAVAITAETITQSAGTGTTTFNGAVNSSATSGISLTGTNLAVNAGITAAGGGTVTVNESGTATFATAGDINADGAVSLTATGGISTAGDITTTADAVTYASAVTLTGPVAVDSAGGAISFNSTVNSDAALTTRDLTLTAGAGNIIFTDVVGTTNALEDLAIVSAANVTAVAITAETITQTAGSGTTTLNGAVNTSAAGGISLTGTNLAVNSTVTTAGGGTVTVNEAGTATFAATGDISADGAVSLTATGGISTAGDVTTTNDNVTYVSAVTLTGPVAVNTGAGPGNISFSSTVNGSEDLTLTAGTGSVTFSGISGGTTRLEDVTIQSAGAVDIDAAFSAETLTQVAGSGTTTIDAAVDTSAAAGVSLTGTNLAVNAGITTATGGTVTVNQSGTATFAAAGDIIADGAVSLTAGGGISTAGNITTTNDNVTYVSTVTLTGAVQITAGSGDVTFSSTVNGGQDLTVNASGTTTFAAAVGGTTALASVTTDAGGTTAINGGTVSTTSAQNYNDAVTLGANTSLTVSTATFNGTLAGGGNSLSVTGNAVFGDATGDTVTGLSTLGVSGITAINTSTVTTTGTQTYSGAVVLGADTTLTTTNSAVTFASTLDSSNLTARDLTVDAGTGAVTLTGTVGGTNVLDMITLNSTGTTTLGGAVTTGSLVTNAGGTTAINGGAVTTTGTQTYNDPVTLNAAANATTLTGTDISFAGTVRSTTDGEEALTVTGSGTTTFVGAVGDNSQRLASLTSNGGGTTVLDGGSVTTTGAQTYTDAVTLGADTTLATTNSTVGFASTLDSSSATARDLTVNAGGGAITMSGAVGGTNALDIVALNSTGVTTLGGTFAAAALTTDASGGTAINGGTVTTTGAQTYNDAVTLGADTMLTTTNSAVTFATTLNSATATARDLMVNAGSGAITATGVVGGVNALDAVALNSTGATTLTSAVSAGSLTTDAGGTTAINGGTVTTSGAQIYNDAVTLGANTVLTVATATFNGTLAGGGSSLTVTGNSVLGDATGDTVTGLSTLGVSGSTTINTSTVTTTGTQTYSGAVVLGADTTLTTTDSAVGFASTVNSADATARDLTVSTGSGAITATGIVGGTNALDAITLNTTGTTTLGSAVTGGSLTTDAGGATAINGGAVTTTGAQTYNDPVTINAAGNATTLTGTNVTFASTVRSATDGEDALTVTGSGTTTFVGAVGDNSQRLAALTSNGGGTTILNGGSVTTTGAQTFTDAVVMDTAGNLMTFTGSDVGFGSSLRSLADGEEALVVNTTGTTSFGGPVGDNGQRLATLTSNTTGLTAINADVTTVGAQTYFDDVQIDGDAILTTTNSAVTFTDDIDSQASEANDLTVNSGTAAITVGGVIGMKPGGAMGTVTFNNTYTGGFIIPTTTAAGLSVTTGGPVTDTGSLAISGQATISAGTNTVTLGDAVGETTNFGSLAVTGGTVIVTEDSGTNLTGITADTLTLTSAGDITDSPGTTINVAGLAAFDSGANDITLGDDPFAPGTLDTTNFGTLTIASAGAVTITEDSSMDLTATTTGDITVRGVGVNIAGVTAPAITVYSTGPITDSGPLLISGLALFDAGSFDVTLDDNGNNFSTVQLFGATITITDADLFTLQGLLSSGPFTALSVGDMTVTAALNAAFDLSLTAQNGSLILNAPVSSGGNLTLTAGQRFESSSTLAAGGAIQIEAGTSALFTGNLYVTGLFTVEATSVRFDGSLNGDSATGDLRVLTDGETRFNGTIGDANPMFNLTTDAGGTTHLAGGTVAVAGTLEFRDDVVVDTNTTVTATTLNVHESFVGGTDGGQTLALNVSGDAVFDGIVGGTGSRFASVGTDAAGRTLFYGGSLRTTGDQIFRDPVLLGRSMIFAGNNVTFANTVNTGAATSPLTDGSTQAAAGDSDLAIVAAGRTLFEAAVGQESAGRLGQVVIGDAASTVDTTELQANFNATSLEINNPVTFNGVGSAFTVDTTATQTYANAATLVTDMTFNSSAASAVEGITFQDEISGAGRNISLTAPTGAITTVGNIGAEDARFAEVRVTGRNVVVGGDIWTTGDIRLAMGEGAAADTNDYLAFNVFGADDTAKSTRLDSEAGEIILGTGATSADPETAGKGDVPLRATIFKSNEGDLVLMARKITVQPNERLAVRNGSFVAIADGSEAGDGITLSSTAASNLLVLATSVTGGEPSIFIRSRAKANMIAPDGTTTVEDQGTELIAGAVLFYNAAFASDATPMPSRTAFSPATEGDNLFAYDTVLAPGNLLTKLGGVVFEVLPPDGGTPELVYVADLLVTNRQYRPTVGNLTYLTMTTVSTAFGGLANQFITPDLFGDIPSASFAQTIVVSENAAPQQTAQTVFIPTGAPVESASAPPEADLAAAVREQLQALGIYARALTPEEKEARDRLAATFVTVPGRERPAESDYEVADARVEDRAVREVLRVANEVGLIGEGQEALIDVAQALQTTYDKYRASSTQADLDAKTLVSEYLAWLEADQGPESVKVLAYLKSLGTTIRKIELLGLTAQELEVSKAQIYGSVLRDRLNVDPEFLSELVKRVSEEAPVAAKDEKKTDEAPKAAPILQAAASAHPADVSAVN